MALFRTFQEVSPLFRMLDECAIATSRRGFPSAVSSTRAFQPRFDVREVRDNFELHGELPGIAQEDINLQWDDSQTLTISGRTERTHTGSGPTSSAADTTPAPHRATVEDAPEEARPEASNTGAVEQTTEVTRAEPSEKPKYWLSERAVGEFSRSWKFPGQLDQDKVRARLRNGILSVIIPKSKVTPPKKITVE